MRYIGNLSPFEVFAGSPLPDHRMNTPAAPPTDPAPWDQPPSVTMTYSGDTPLDFVRKGVRSKSKSNKMPAVAEAEEEEDLAQPVESAPLGRFGGMQGVETGDPLDPLVEAKIEPSLSDSPEPPSGSSGDRTAGSSTHRVSLSDEEDEEDVEREDDVEPEIAELLTQMLPSWATPAGAFTEGSESMYVDGITPVRETETRTSRCISGCQIA